MEEKEFNKRAAYTAVTIDQQIRIDLLRKAFSDLYNRLDELTYESRETSLALTKLEEAQMWAIKGISREEIK